MVEIGQLVMKIAGRDSGEISVIVDQLDHTYVLIDGNTRRKKCNIRHLEFLSKKIDIKKNAASESIKKELEKLGIKIKKKGKKKESKSAPKKQRKQKVIKTQESEKSKGVKKKKQGVSEGQNKKEKQ